MSLFVALAVFAIFLSPKPGNLQDLDCKLSITATNNREKIYYEVFHWTPPKDNLDQKENKIIRSGQTVSLHCGNGFLKNEFINNDYTFGCNRGKFNKTFLYEDLLCRGNDYKNIKVVETPPSQFRSKLFKCLETDYKLYQVKLEKADGSMKLLYSSCVDKKQMRTKFAHQPRRTEKPLLRYRPDDAVWGFDGFGEDTNEKFYLSKGYVKKIQAKRVARAYPKRYGETKDYPHYFNRGHLVAMADFNDETEQRASCQYINAAPQWDILNSNSWSLVEREAREMLQKNTDHWEIFTGTYEIIPTPTGLLYVAPILDRNGVFKKKLLPVPMLFWKIVYNSKNESESRAFVGVNNPEFKSPEEIPQSYKICSPMKHQTEGVYIVGNEFHGFIYECKVDELLKKLKSVEKVVK